MYKCVVVLKCLITRLHQTLDTRVPVHTVDLSIFFGWGFENDIFSAFNMIKKHSEFARKHTLYM